ncbi:sugar transferase [Solitalea agri]|uniref:sugar transferase n=1 Tax=Solitalea TaxID=929509 RepID=UPI00244AA548|nr:sugar transferase [Solitalea agri]
MNYSLSKRALDLAISITACILLMPVFVLLSIILAISLKGNPFFAQIRPGRYEKPFKMFKFRTMSNARGKDGKLLPDDERLSIIGTFIRKTSLDETPQLFNVILGEMSIVGPRPLMREYLLFSDDSQRCRQDVLPGITGWAQVNGRNSLTWDQKLSYDIWYVKNASFKIDIEILFKTFRTVFLGIGINQPGCVTTVPPTKAPVLMNIMEDLNSEVVYQPANTTWNRFSNIKVRFKVEFKSNKEYIQNPNYSSTSMLSDIDADILDNPIINDDYNSVRMDKGLPS